MRGTNIPIPIKFGIFVLAYPNDEPVSEGRRGRENGNEFRMGDPNIMDAPQDFEALKRRLIEIKPELPKRLRQTAAFALEHPDEVALGTASEHRRARRGAGFDLGAVRPDAWVRRLLGTSGRLPRASAQPLARLFRAPEGAERGRPRQRRSVAALFGFADSAAASIAKLRGEVHREELDEAIAFSPARAPSISPGSAARSASRIISPMRSPSSASARSLIDNVGGLGPEQLAGAGEDDALIAISFSPYAPFTIAQVEAARKRRPRSSSSPTAR